MDIDEALLLVKRVKPKHRRLVARIALLGMNMSQEKRAILAKQIIDDILKPKENIFRKLINRISAWFR
jgi:hypothetical protein